MATPIRRLPAARPLTDRAVDDPVALATAARIIRAALSRRRPPSAPACEARAG